MALAQPLGNLVLILSKKKLKPKTKTNKKTGSISCRVPAPGIKRPEEPTDVGPLGVATTSG